MSITKRTCLIIGFVALFAAVTVPKTSHAIPLLQLDIGGGFYVGGGDTGTTFAASDTFTLYALINTAHPHYAENAGGDYSISIAVVPSLAETVPSPDLGSFELEGVGTIAVTSAMSYGTPPLDSLPPDDLASHGIFSTYFTELTFSEPAATALAYNVQTDVGDPVFDPAGTLKVFEIDFDVSNLADGIELHFDLYTREASPSNDLARFAPFSKDAESGVIPEPASMVIWGLLASAGLCVGWRRRQQRAA